MTITTKHDGDSIVLQVEGRVDTGTSPQLQSEILKSFQGAKRLVLDFSKVVMISSAGLRALLIGQKTATTKGATMELTQVGEQVKAVLEMSGFSNFLTVL